MSTEPFVTRRRSTRCQTNPSSSSTSPTRRPCGPNRWGSEGEGDRFGSRLGPDDLERLGRSDVAAQVKDSRESGVQTFAWLPKDHGAGALAQYAREQQADLIFVPDKLEWIDELSSVLAGSTKNQDVRELGIELRTVPPEVSPDPSA